MANEFAPNRQDANVNPADIAMPAAASTAVNQASIDLGPVDPLLANIELEIIAPALNTTMLPDTRTMSYKIQDSSDNSSFSDLIDCTDLQQTGAGGAGAVTATKRYRLPSSVNRYVRVVVTSGGSTTDSSAVNLETNVLFGK